MKVCFFDFTVNFGGGPQGSIYLMHRLQQKNISCSILDAFGVSKDYKAKAEEYNLDYRILYKQLEGVTIGHNENRFLRLLGFVKQSKNFSQVTLNLIKQINNIKPDVLIVNNEKSLFFAYIAKLFFDFKILLYFRGEGTKSQLTSRFIKSLNSKANHVVAHSKAAVENLIKAGVHSSNISYIPNCIDFDINAQKSPVSNIASYGTFKIILTAARPVKEKGYHTAVEALYRLKLKGYKIDLFLPGITPTGSDKEYENYLISLIKKLGLENSVHFIGWRDNLITDIIASDLVILPSHTEGFPRSIIESMINGVPVCATPVGGIPEAIIHRETGMLFDVDDVEGLENCIKELIDDSSLYVSILNKAQSFSKEYFNPQHNTLGIIAILETLKGQDL